MHAASQWVYEPLQCSFRKSVIEKHAVQFLRSEQLEETIAFWCVGEESYSS